MRAADGVRRADVGIAPRVREVDNERNGCRFALPGAVGRAVGEGVRTDKIRVGHIVEAAVGLQLDGAVSGFLMEDGIQHMSTRGIVVCQDTGGGNSQACIFGCCVGIFYAARRMAEVEHQVRLDFAAVEAHVVEHPAEPVHTVFIIWAHVVIVGLIAWRPQLKISVRDLLAGGIAAVVDVFAVKINRVFAVACSLLDLERKDEMMPCVLLDGGGGKLPAVDDDVEFKAVDVGDDVLLRVGVVGAPYPAEVEENLVAREVVRVVAVEPEREGCVRRAGEGKSWRAAALDWSVALIQAGGIAEHACVVRDLALGE